jgi:type VI secretion system protein ImpH
MDTTAGRETFAVERDLLGNPRHFSFIQAVRLLCRATDADEPFRAIRIRPNLAWNTPAQEIVSIEKSETPHALYRLTVTFLELYGVGSPLPMFYTQDLLREQLKSCSANREFLDVFNGVLYEIFFDIWKKYHLSYRLFESPDPALWEQLFCTCGMGNGVVRQKLSHPQAQIAFSGLTSRPMRTAEGLRVILADILGNVPVAIDQCVTRRAPIPDAQRVRLGVSSTTLGDDAHIGIQIQERMGSFRVLIGPLPADRLEQFLPGTPTMSMIAELIRVYVNQPLRWDIEISCRTQGLTTVCLGERKKAFLGWNTWVFSGKSARETVTARFGAE